MIISYLEIRIGYFGWVGSRLIGSNFRLNYFTLGIYVEDGPICMHSHKPCMHACTANQELLPNY